MFFVELCTMPTFFYFFIELGLLVSGMFLIWLGDADAVVGALFLCTGVLMSAIWHVKEELLRKLKSISRH